ncbi:MAG: acetylxylan esterase, partial [Verrucomicrobiaceae bacterium]
MPETFHPNYEEAKVPPYNLPDPLRMEDGREVKVAAMWHEDRRCEILRLFEEHVYGRTPRDSLTLQFETREVEDGALDGLAIRKQISIRLGDQANGRRLNLLVYLPRTSQPAPVFLGLNFHGNHTIHPDPSIFVTPQWVSNIGALGVADHRAGEAGRGGMAKRWPVEAILTRGYGLATAYCGDLDPDFDDGFQNGVHPLFLRPGQPRPAMDEWGSIGAWAWGLSRTLDYLETDSGVDVA